MICQIRRPDIDADIALSHQKQCQGLVSLIAVLCVISGNPRQLHSKKLYFDEHGAMGSVKQSSRLMDVACVDLLLGELSDTLNTSSSDVKPHYHYTRLAETTSRQHSSNEGLRTLGHQIGLRLAAR